MGLFTRALKSEQGAKPVTNTYTESAFISALQQDIVVTKETIMSLPAVQRNVDWIANTISTLDFHLYEKDESGNVKDKCDYRTVLLNKSSNSSIKSNDIIKNLVIDYLVYGSGYAYLKKRLNTIEAIQYIDSNKISVMSNDSDPLNPTHKLSIQGKDIDPYSMICLLNGGTTNGYIGAGGLINTSKDIIKLGYIANKTLSIISSQSKLVATTKDKIHEDGIKFLNAHLKRILDEDSGLLVLNSGVDLKELGRNATESQITQIYQEVEKQLSYVLGVPLSVLDGTCTDEVYNQTVKSVIMPIIDALESSISDVMLLEIEKEKCEFKIDTNGLMRMDFKQLLEAYDIGIKAGIYTRNEVRKLLNLDIIEGLDMHVLSLGDVLYDPNTKSYVNFNMDSVQSIDDVGKKGSEINGTKTV